jgi:hypothetical protein
MKSQRQMMEHSCGRSWNESEHITINRSGTVFWQAFNLTILQTLILWQATASGNQEKGERKRSRKAEVMSNYHF